MTDFKQKFKRCFYEIVGNDDPFITIVRGQLYCESALSALLRKNIPKPDALDIDRIEYQSKVKLASALNLLGKFDICPALSQIGKFRNKYVHDLDYTVTADDQLNLINTLKATMGGPAHFLFREQQKFPIGIQKAIIAVWVPLEMLLVEPKEAAQFSGYVDELLHEYREANG